MTMPTFVNLPSEYRDAYRPSAVIAAVPMGHGNVYAVTGIDPQSPRKAPTYITAEVSRGHADGPWFADEYQQHTLLSSALLTMAKLAGLRPHGLPRTRAEMMPEPVFPMTPMRRPE